MNFATNVRYVHFFAEKHGKTPLDGSFSHVSLYLKQREKIGKIYSVEDVKDAVEQGHQTANAASFLHGREKSSRMGCILFNPAVLERKEHQVLELPVNTLKQYNCFSFVEGKLSVKLLSKDFEWHDLKCKIKTRKRVQKKKISCPYVDPAEQKRQVRLRKLHEVPGQSKAKKPPQKKRRLNNSREVASE